MPRFNSRDPLPGTPGYVGESSQRHAEQSDYETPEVRPNQRTPEPLQEEGGGGGGEIGLTQKFSDPTRHASK